MSESAGVGGADGGGDGGDFVFGLKGHDAEILVLRKFVQNVGRRSDRIGAQKQRQAGFLRGGHKTDAPAPDFR